MRVGAARLTAGLLALTALSALRPADLEAAGSRVAIISPKDGNVISGTITIQVTVTGDVVANYLIVGVDEDRPYATNCEPYEIQFDSTQYANGVHYLWAEAYTTAAPIGTSQRIKVTVANDNLSAPPPLPRTASKPAEEAPPASPKSDVAKPKPASVKPKPVPVEPKPTSVEPKPVPVEPKPTSVEPKPVSTEPKPTVAEPKPILVEPNPAPEYVGPAPKGLSVVLMGERLRTDVRSRVSDGRVLVGFRGVFEQLGATVHWRSEERTATALRDGHLIEVTIGSKIARIDGKEILLDRAAYIQHQRTVVPLRFCAESLDYEVAWRHASRRAEVYSTELLARTE